MTLHAVTVPKWGLTMEEGTLLSWLVPDGAAVTAGLEIAEIETSKIANAVAATAAGSLHQVARPGDLKTVGALLGIIADAGENDAALAAFKASWHDASRADNRAVEAPVLDSVVVDGATLTFQKVRAAPSDGAPGSRGSLPVVFIHGFGGNHQNWLFNQEALTAGRDTYALDLPGHGGSSKQIGDGTLETLAACLAAWLDDQALTTVHLVGHSMGAAVAASLALEHPRKVASLTALCGVGFGGSLDRAYLEAFLAANRRKDLKAATQMLFADPTRVTGQMLDELLAYKRTDGVAAALRQLADTALAEDAQSRLRRRLSEIRAPMLAIFGAQDRLLGAPSPDNFPAQIAIIESAGHMPHLEAPTAVNARIAEFVRQHA